MFHTKIEQSVKRCKFCKFYSKFEIRNDKPRDSKLNGSKNFLNLIRSLFLRECNFDFLLSCTFPHFRRT
jgi:hypothetical protein